jgi:hypothetical protein
MVTTARLDRVMGLDRLDPSTFPPLGLSVEIEALPAAGADPIGSVGLCLDRATRVPLAAGVARLQSIGLAATLDAIAVGIIDGLPVPPLFPVKWKRLEVGGTTRKYKHKRGQKVPTVLYARIADLGTAMFAGAPWTWAQLLVSWGFEVAAGRCLPTVGGQWEDGGRYTFILRSTVAEVADA